MFSNSYNGTRTTEEEVMRSAYKQAKPNRNQIELLQLTWIHWQKLQKNQSLSLLIQEVLSMADLPHQASLTPKRTHDSTPSNEHKMLIMKGKQIQQYGAEPTNSRSRKAPDISSFKDDRINHKAKLGKRQKAKGEHWIPEQHCWREEGDHPCYTWQVWFRLMILYLALYQLFACWDYQRKLCDASPNDIQTFRGSYEVLEHPTDSTKAI